MSGDPAIQRAAELGDRRSRDLMWLDIGKPISDHPTDPVHPCAVCGIQVDTSQSWLRRDAGMIATSVDLDFCSATCFDRWLEANGLA